MPGEGIGVWSKIDSILRSNKISAIFYSYARCITEIHSIYRKLYYHRLTNNPPRMRKKYFLSFLKETKDEN